VIKPSPNLLVVEIPEIPGMTTGAAGSLSLAQDGERQKKSKTVVPTSELEILAFTGKAYFTARTPATGKFSLSLKILSCADATCEKTKRKSSYDFLK